jgi:hypothetical protein
MRYLITLDNNKYEPVPQDQWDEWDWRMIIMLGMSECGKD